MGVAELRVLGLPSLRVGGEARALPAKAFAVLATLGLAGPQSRAALAALLWDRERALARQNLRGAVMALRRALHPHEALLHVSPDALAVDLGRLWVDARTLEGASPEDLLGLWRGPLLEGLGVRDSASWDDWVTGQEEVLMGLHLGRCLELGTSALGAGDPALAAALAAQALRVTPDSEHAARLLIRSQWSEGREALAHLSAAQFRRRFRAEFGADPDLPALPLPAAPLPQARSPLPRPPPAPTPWPQPLTSFIGRDLERLAVLEALRAGRLVTLHGPAGIGKTRLALQVARDVQAGQPELRVRFVPLDDLREPGAVLPRLAEMLDLPPGPDPLATLTAALRDTDALLILDNAEHLPGVASAWPPLLAACPGVRLLVTSREVLHLRAEQVMPLDGLDVPAPDCSPARARQADAVRLFTERARQAGAAFLDGGTLEGAALAEVRHLCALLGGAPLGLELAAAWTRVQTLPELRRALEAAVLDLASPHRDARPRHQGLRAALDHSWALLPGEVRRDFCALGVFPASFDAGAALAVLGASPGRLAALLDRALLRRDAAGRYHAHPLVRAFAREKLGADPARQRRLADRHAAHYRAGLGRLNSEASGGASPPLLAYAAAEEANLLALIEHLLAAPELEGLAGVAEGLLWHFPVRGRPDDGLRLCRRVVAALRPHGERADRALAAFLSTQGWLEYFFGSLYEARRLCEEAAVRARRVGDPLELTRALGGLGDAQARLGQFAGAVAACRAGVEAAAALGPVRRSRMLAGLGHALAYAGETGEVARVCAAARALLDAGGVDSPMDTITILNVEGAGHIMAGDLGAALTAFTRSADLARAIGSVGQLPSLLTFTALAHALHPGPRSPAQAEACMTRARDLLGERREAWTECLLEQVGARLALRRGDPGAALAHCTRAFRAAWPSSNVAVTFWVLPVYARDLAAGGDLPRAAEVAGLLLAHPASGGWTRRQAEALLEEWREQELMDGLEAAVKRGAGLEVGTLFSWT